LSSATEKAPARKPLGRWIVVEAAGLRFAFPLDELDAVVEIGSSRIKRTQGRRRPGYLGIVEWAGAERDLRSLAEHLGLPSRVNENYPTLVTRPPADENGGGTDSESEPFFWAVEKVIGSFESLTVQTEPVPPEWWAHSSAPFHALWWHEDRPVWVVRTSALVSNQTQAEGVAS